MYVYKTSSSIDWWHGITRLIDFIRLCHSSVIYDHWEFDNKTNQNENELFYPSHNKLKCFLRRSFVNLIFSEAGWQGDIRDDDCIGISAVPFSCISHPDKILVLKQDTNGESFIVAESSILTNENIELVKDKDLDGYDADGLICEFSLVDELIEDIFSRASNKPKVKEEKNNILDIAKDCIARHESKESFDGILLSDFGRID